MGHPAPRLVYGDADEHTQSIPKLAGMFKWQPATKLSLVHHRDIDTAVEVALTGAMDGRIVNIVDEAPMTIYEITQLVDATMEPSSEPLSNPFYGYLDGSRARSRGFKPKVRTIYQAIEEGAL